MDAPPRPAAAGRVRGIYAREDEAAAFLQQGIPTFATGDACSAWIRQHCVAQRPPSNPERPHMQQLFTTSVTEEQLKAHVVDARAAYLVPMLLRGELSSLPVVGKCVRCSSSVCSTVRGEMNPCDGS